MSNQITLRLIDEPPNPRRTIYRMALLYTPAAVLVGTLALIPIVSLLQGSTGAIIGVILLGPTAAALGFQAIVALRDLRAQPVTTRGVLRRVWDKGTVLWVSRAYYLRVDMPHPTRPGKQVRRVFVVSPAASDLVERSHEQRHATLTSMRRADLEQQARCTGIDFDTKWDKSMIAEAICGDEAGVEIEHWPHTNTVIRISLVEHEQERGSSGSSRPTR